MDLLARSTLSHAWQAEGSWGWDSTIHGGGQKGGGGFILVAILEAVSKVEMGEREWSEMGDASHENERVCCLVRCGEWILARS